VHEIGTVNNGRFLEFIRYCGQIRMNNAKHMRATHLTTASFLT
jgi:hypothetical protein